MVTRAADAPPENRTGCEDLLLNNGHYGPVKEGFEELSFSFEGMERAIGSMTTIAYLRERLAEIGAVLEQSGVSEDVLFIQRDFHSHVNVLALELLVKGIPADAVDKFHGDWRLSEPGRLIIWDIRDPLYLTLQCTVRGNCESFNFWIRTANKTKVLNLLRDRIKDAKFFDRRRGGPGHVT